MVVPPLDVLFGDASSGDVVDPPQADPSSPAAPAAPPVPAAPRKRKPVSQETLEKRAETRRARKEETQRKLAWYDALTARNELLERQLAHVLQYAKTWRGRVPDAALMHEGLHQLMQQMHEEDGSELSRSLFSAQ